MPSWRVKPQSVLFLTLGLALIGGLQAAGPAPSPSSEAAVSEGVDLEPVESAAEPLKNVSPGVPTGNKVLDRLLAEHRKATETAHAASVPGRQFVVPLRERAGAEPAAPSELLGRGEQHGPEGNEQAELEPRRAQWGEAASTRDEPAPHSRGGHDDPESAGTGPRYRGDFDGVHPGAWMKRAIRALRENRDWVIGAAALVAIIAAHFINHHRRRTRRHRHVHTSRPGLRKVATTTSVGRPNAPPRLVHPAHPTSSSPTPASRPVHGEAPAGGGRRTARRDHAPHPSARSRRTVG